MHSAAVLRQSVCLAYGEVFKLPKGTAPALKIVEGSFVDAQPGNFIFTYLLS